MGLSGRHEASSSRQSTPSDSLPWRHESSPVMNSARQSSTTSVGSGSGVIGGQAFYDNDNDGMRDDNNGINGVPNINVWLLSCDPDQTIAHFVTPSNGIYRFVDLAPGSYYIVAQPPREYHFSPGERVINDIIILDSTIDSESGRTICFELKDGEKTMDWSFGLHRPSDRPSPSPTVTHTPTAAESNGPSNAPSDSPITDHPTLRPSRRPSLGPSPNPSFRPSLKPSPRPSLRPSPKPSPNPSPNPSPGPSPRPSHEPSFRPSGRPTSQLPSESPTIPSATTPTPTFNLTNAGGSEYSDSISIANIIPTTSLNQITAWDDDNVNMGNSNDDDDRVLWFSDDVSGISNAETAIVKTTIGIVMAFLAILGVAFFVLARKKKTNSGGGVDVKAPRETRDDLELGMSDSSDEAPPSPSSSPHAPPRTYSQMGKYAQEQAASIDGENSIDLSLEVQETAPPKLMPVPPRYSRTEDNKSMESHNMSIQSLEHELNSLWAVIQSYPKNTREWKMLRSNYAIVKAELDRTIAQNAEFAAAAGVDDTASSSNGAGIHDSANSINSYSYSEDTSFPSSAASSSEKSLSSPQQTADLALLVRAALYTDAAGEDDEKSPPSPQKNSDLAGMDGRCSSDSAGSSNGNSGETSFPSTAGIDDSAGSSNGDGVKASFHSTAGMDDSASSSNSYNNSGETSFPSSNTSSVKSLPSPHQNSDLELLVRTTLSKHATGGVTNPEDSSNTSSNTSSYTSRSTPVDDKGMISPSRSYLSHNSFGETSSPSSHSAENSLPSPRQKSNVELLMRVALDVLDNNPSSRSYSSHHDSTEQASNTSLNKSLVIAALSNNTAAEEGARGSDTTHDYSKVPPSRSYSTCDSSEKKTMPCPPHWTPSSKSNHFDEANDADIEKKIDDLEAELVAHYGSIELHREKSEQWHQITAFIERALEELYTFRQQGNVRILHPREFHIMAPPGNLGLVVDKNNSRDGVEAGLVYIRSIHPSSPLRNRVQLMDKIIAIDGQDLQHSSAREVGKLLIRNPMSSQRRIFILRETNHVLVAQFLEHANQSPPMRSKLEENSQSRLEPIRGQSLTDVLAGYGQSHANQSPPSSIVIVNEKYLNQKSGPEHTAGLGLTDAPNSAGPKEQDSTHDEPSVMSQNPGAPEENLQPVPRDILTFQCSASMSDESTAIDEFTKSNDGEIIAQSLQTSLDLKKDHVDEVDDLAVKTEQELALASKTAVSAQTVPLPNVARQIRVEEEYNEIIGEKIEEITLSLESSMISSDIIFLPSISSDESSQSGFQEGTLQSLTGSETERITHTTSPTNSEESAIECYAELLSNIKHLSTSLEGSSQFGQSSTDTLRSEIDRITPTNSSTKSEENAIESHAVLLSNIESAVKSHVELLSNIKHLSVSSQKNSPSGLQKGTIQSSADVLGSGMDRIKPKNSHTKSKKRANENYTELVSNIKHFITKLEDGRLDETGDFVMKPAKQEALSSVLSSLLYTIEEEPSTVQDVDRMAQDPEECNDMHCKEVDELAVKSKRELASTSTDSQIELARMIQTKEKRASKRISSGSRKRRHRAMLKMSAKISARQTKD